VSIELAPGGGAFARYPLWRVKHPIARHAAQWDAGREDIGAALAACEAEWDRLRWQVRSVDWVLSNHYLRFLALDGAERLGYADSLALARERMAGRYGEGARGWALSLHRGAAGERRVAAAVPAELLGGIRDFCRKRGLRLGGVKPAFSVAMQSAAARLKAPSGWFVQVEPGRICAARYSSRGCEAVHNLRAGEPGAELAALLARDAALTGLERGATVVFLQGAVAGLKSALEGSGWRVTVLAETGA
jgi:hypothetical protein